MSERKWIIKDETVKPEIISDLTDKLKCGELLASVIASRGINLAEEAERFLSLNNLWLDPMLLPDMAVALNRVKSARSRNELVAVFGDYDADGITATAIMKSCLEEFGIKTCKYIPDRNKEGYGLNKGAVDSLCKDGVKLIITVDCGVSCKEEVDYASGLGIDVLVTDHHNCPDVLPVCCAVINPKRKDSLYPCKHLAGAGVAYKFACALIGFEDAEKYLQLAAIGTVADVVELTGENRKIVARGIELMKEEPLPGIEALLLLSSKQEITSSSLAFTVAPRINSSGRMDSPDLSYELLVSENFDTATELAKQLDGFNRARQQAEQVIYEEAINIIGSRALYNDIVIVAGKHGWNPGVIGIAAAKITERTNRPCILIAYSSDGIGRASGRSVEGFDLYEAIKASEGLLIKYGGHALAAGLSIEEGNEEKFRRVINDYASGIYTKELATRKIYIDSVVRPEALTIRNIEELSRLEPFGAGNEKPVFAFVNSQLADIKELSDGKHLKLTVKKKDYTLDAIAFGYGSFSKKLYKGMTIHLAGNIEINDYTGRPQLIVKDILY